MLWFCVVTADHKHLSPSMSYLGGAIAGSAATIGSYPFDLLRTILACQGEPKVTVPEACYLSFCSLKHMRLVMHNWRLYFVDVLVMHHVAHASFFLLAILCLVIF